MEEKIVTSPTEPSPPQTKRRSTCVPIIMIVALLCMCATLGALQLRNLQKTKDTNSSPLPTISISTTHIPQDFDLKTNTPFVVQDLYNDQLRFTKGDQVYVAEMDLLRYVLEQAVANHWSGQENSKLPISKATFPKEKIDKYAQDNQRIDDYFVIPNTLRPLFITGNASQEVTDLIYSARKEYLRYLASKGVAQKYINEIDQNTLPESSSRIIYHAVDGYDNPPSAVESIRNANGEKDDYSKLQMDIYGGDVYNHTRTLFKSGILGPVPTDENSSAYYESYKRYREIAIRYLIYHEMSHVLQRAVDTQNVPTEDRTTKSSWIYASKSMWKISNKYFVKWDKLESFTDVENHNLSQESQAEGISYEMLTNVFNLSTVQKRLLWEYLFGRLDTARDNYVTSINIFAQHFPNFPITDINDRVYEDLVSQYTPGSYEATALYNVQKRMGNLSSYGGYFNPVLPEDMGAVWEYVKK